MTDGRRPQRRLVDELPELVDYIRAGLTEQNRQDLVPDIETAVVHEVSLQSSHAAIELVPNLDPAAMMAHPHRERFGSAHHGECRDGDGPSASM
jgi:hypothetical protein